MRGNLAQARNSCLPTLHSVHCYIERLYVRFDPNSMPPSSQRATLREPGEWGCPHGACEYSDMVVTPSKMTSARSAESSSGAAGLSLPRAATAAAVGIGLVAVGAGIARRLIRGPTRSTPPIAPKKPHTVVFGKQEGAEIGDIEIAMDPPVERNDDYFWLRDDSRKSKEVLQHLRAENAFTNYKTLALKRSTKSLYKELLSHVQETDVGVPAKRDAFVYYSRTLEGSSYTFHCRKPILADGTHGVEEVILDENAIARGQKHCDINDIAVSPDHQLMAYSVDFSGDEVYDILIMDLKTRDVLDRDTIRKTSGSIVWGKDNNTMYYCTLDDAHRPNKVWRHTLKSVYAAAADAPPVEDVCLYTETDEMFSVGFWKSLCDRHLYIGSFASTTTEQRYIDLEVADPRAEPTVHLIAERQKNVMYTALVEGNRFYIVTNRDGATNFKLMESAIGGSVADWTDVMPYNQDRNILGVVAFEDFSVLSGREGGFSAVWVMPKHEPSDMWKIEFDEEACVTWIGENHEFKTSTLRVGFSSMVTPSQVWDINLDTKERTLMKETPVPNYDRTLYRTERIEAEAADGTRIPMSLVWREDAIRKNEPNLLHLYGYGSYQISIDPTFSPKILPLLDRGFIHAIAHIRGGGEGGRVWYEQARFETKKKTFEDFIACAEHLIATGRTEPSKLSIEGRSAGGLLMGSVLNMRPDLFRASIAGVPFVDVLNTMSDATIPLTTGEWLEWGNPHEKKYFDAIREYCPYTNVEKKPYPAILALAGLHDPRVLYSEPAKWVAKLREHSTSDHDILLKTDLSSGHFSASDRYRYLRERAFELSWLMNELGVAETPKS